MDVEGKPKGVPNNNPLLDQQQYVVEFMDGRIEVLTANIIAENLLSQVVSSGVKEGTPYGQAFEIRTSFFEGGVNSVTNKLRRPGH